MTPVAFYCVSSELYFPGAVGLVNSLRLVGHEEPIYVLDCGLEPAHRARLEREATVLDAPAGAQPYLLKTVAPLAHEADVRVLLDADMIATRSLAPLIERAAAGGACAVKDRLDRWDARWGGLLGFGEIAVRPYVSSGLVALGGEAGDDVLRTWHDRLDRVDFERSYFVADEAGYPFRFIDQDILNAAIAARLDPGQVEVMEPGLVPSPPFRGVRLRDETTLRCTNRDGSEPLVLHHYLRKPWLEPMYHGLYSRLLARLLLGDDVAIALDPDELPLRMRRGALARLERRRVDAQDLVRWYARDVIPEWLEARLEGLRARSGRGS